MQVTIKEIELKNYDRVLVTSDIHGNFDLFIKILEKANFTKNDLLIIIGDILERGTNSLALLQYIMELSKEYNVITLMGNNDLWQFSTSEKLTKENMALAEDFFNNISRIKKYHTTSFYHEMAAELSYEIHSPQDILDINEEIKVKFKSEYDFLRLLPTVLLTENFIFVHAGLDTEDKDKLLNKGIYELLKYDNFFNENNLTFSKTVVVGHFPCVLYQKKKGDYNPISNEEQNIISIDGGLEVKRHGQLNMIMLKYNTTLNDIKHIYVDDLPIYIAVEDQKESKDSINITFLDNKIKIIKTGKEFDLVEHISTGYTLIMDKDYIYEENIDLNYCLCSDYTDYEHEIKKGDNISLIKTIGASHMIKKDGVVGWYHKNIKSLKRA